ncbi:MAG: hypothetical protein GTO40_23060, partial [Deltaproteobacteria bacterium]|nr:hypothetical protein [Deltaproteobacteria bacterium]
MRTTLWLKRIAATLGIGLGVILVTAVVLSVILRLPYFQAKVRAQIEHLFEANTRYEVQLDSARLDPLLRSLTILNLQVSAKGHPRQEPMVVIERTLISPNLWELLRLRLRLKSIFLYHPKVVVHAGQSEAGTGTAAEVQLKPLVMPLGATRVAVENGEVAWEWGGGGIKLSGLQSRLRSSSGGVAATVTIGESTIVSGNTSLLATDFQLDAELANDNIELKNLSLNAMGSIIEGNGRLENFRANPKLDVDLDAWGPVLDLFPRKPPIRLSGNYRLKGKLTGAIDDPIFMGEADIGQGNVDQIDIVGMTFRVDGNRNRIRLTELDVQGTEGQMQGEMTLIWDSLQYRLNLRGGGINLTRVLRPVTDQKQVGGRVAIEAEILGRGGDLSRLKGRMRAQVEAFHFLKRPEEQGRITVSLEGSG